MEFHTSPETVSPEEVDDLLPDLAATDPAKFALLFRDLRDRFPREVGRTCIRCLARESTEQSMLNQLFSWLKPINYFKSLLDPEFLSVQDATRAAELLRTEDPHFFVNFSRLTGNFAGGEDSPSLCHIRPRCTRRAAVWALGYLALSV